MFNDGRAGCARGKAGNDGGNKGGMFLGCAMFIGNPGLTVAVATGVGSRVR